MKDFSKHIFYTTLCNDVAITGGDVASLIPPEVIDSYRKCSRTVALRVKHPIAHGKEERVAGLSSTTFTTLHGALPAPEGLCTVLLEGKGENGRLVHAKFTFNRNNPSDGPQLCFSPVPFGPDGRPELGVVGESRELFLRLVGVMLRSTTRGWVAQQMAKKLEEFGFTGDSFTKAVVFGNEMEHMEVVSPWDNHHLGAGTICFKTVMSAQRFKEIFGIELPTAVL